MFVEGRGLLIFRSYRSCAVELPIHFKESREGRRARGFGGPAGFDKASDWNLRNTCSQHAQGAKVTKQHQAMHQE